MEFKPINKDEFAGIIKNITSVKPTELFQVGNKVVSHKFDKTVTVIELDYKTNTFTGSFFENGWKSNTFKITDFTLHSLR